MPNGRVMVELGRHLGMLADQLAASMREADRECVSVGESFHELAAARSSLDEIAGVEPARGELRGICRQMGESLHAAVVALQYHDRLAQRLGLIGAGLDRLQALLHSGADRDHEEWMKALHEVERVNRAERQRLGPESTGSYAIVDERRAADSTVELF